MIFLCALGVWLWWILGGGPGWGPVVRLEGGGFEVWGRGWSEVMVGVMGGVLVLLILGIRNMDIVRDQSSFC